MQTLFLSRKVVQITSHKLPAGLAGGGGLVRWWEGAMERPLLMEAFHIDLLKKEHTREPHLSHA